MRILTLGMTAATAAFLATGGFAYGQTKSAPEKAQGAGAECARTTAPGSRDECVHQKNSGSSATGSSGQSNTSIGSGNNINGEANTSVGTHNSTSGGSQSNTRSNTMSGSSPDRSKR